MPCVFYGIICGVATGGFIFFFKWLSGKVEHISRFLYNLAKASPLYIVITFAALILSGLLLYLLQSKIPEIKGGGIPRSEGVLRGVLSFKPIRTLIGTFFGSMIGFFAGVPLGCEGPAVLMGTCIGGICINLSKNKTAWSRYVTSGGAGAGFAVATGAPLSGILFILEEVHKRFTPMLLLTVSSSVISATLTNLLLCKAFGISSDFLQLGILKSFSLSDILFLLFLGVIVGLAVGVFDGSIAIVNKFTKKLKKFLCPWMKLVIVFVVTGILGFTLCEGLYSGHHVIADLVAGNKILSVTVALLIARFIMMLLVTDSGVTGGIFIPTLTIGALIGTIAAELFVAMGMDGELYNSIILLSMCAFIGGTLRAPLTATVLFIELTGQFTNLFYVALVVFGVYVVTNLLNQTPFYDMVLLGLEEQESNGKVYHEKLFCMKVQHGAFVIGKTVRDVMWPVSCVVLSIRRGEDGNDIGNVGEKVLFADDILMIKAKYSDEQELKNSLLGLVGKDSEITVIEQ